MWNKIWFDFSFDLIFYSVCKLSKLLEILEGAGKLDEATVARVKKFIADNNTFQQNGGSIKRAPDGCGDGEMADKKRQRKVFLTEGMWGKAKK